MTASFRSIGLLTVSALAYSGLQLVLQLMLARWFGAAADMDAYVAAQALPAVLATILVCSIQPAFVPIFLDLHQQDPKRAARLAKRLGLLFAGALTVLVAVLSIAARPVVAVLQPGFSASHAEQTAQLLRLLLWYMWGTGLTTYFQALHYSLNSYRLPALAPVLGFIATLAWIGGRQEPKITDVAAGFAVGGIISALLLSSLWFRHCWFLSGIRPSTAPPVESAPPEDRGEKPERDRNHNRNRDLRRVGRAALPLIGGTLLFKLDPLVDRFLASSLPSGSLSQFGYATRLNAAFITLAVSGLGVVAFQNMARHSAAGNFRAVRDELRYALKLALLTAWPVMILLLAFSRPLIHDLLQRGAFTAEDTEAVAHLLLLHLGVLAGGIAGELLTRGFFALHDTKTPVWIGTSGFVLGVVLKLMLVTRYGIEGLVIATSAVYLMNGVVEYFLLSRLITRRRTRSEAAVPVTETLTKPPSADVEAANSRAESLSPPEHASNPSLESPEASGILTSRETLLTLLRASVASTGGLIAGYGVLQLALPGAGLIAFSLGCLVYGLGLFALHEPTTLSAWQQLRRGRAK